jgi:uncharacterized protein (DUF2147 family)
MREFSMRALLLTIGLALATAAPAFAADPVEREWLVEDGSGKVRIAPCPGKPDRMCGVVTWGTKPPDSKDVHNPDAALRNRLLLGLMVLSDFKPVSPGRWNGGRIYDPTSGKTYASKMAVNAKGALKVEGCILILCEAQTWTPG